MKTQRGSFARHRARDMRSPGEARGTAQRRKPRGHAGPPGGSSCTDESQQCPEAAAAVPLSPNLYSPHLLLVRGGKRSRARLSCKGAGCLPPLGCPRKRRSRGGEARATRAALHGGPAAWQAQHVLVLGAVLSERVSQKHAVPTPGTTATARAAGPAPRRLTPSRSPRTLLSLGRKPSAASAQPRGSERKGRAEKPPALLGPADAEDRRRLRRHRRPRVSAASREARLARRRADPVQGAEPGL